MAKEIKFNIKLNVDGKEQLVAATTNVKDLQRAVDATRDKAKRLSDAFVLANQGVEALNNASDAFASLATTARQSMAVTQLTGETGDAMRSLRSEVAAVAEYYGKDFAEVLRSANAMAKGFGISAQQAMALVRSGFAAGADAGGDFLDTLREYPRYFSEAGISAEAFVAITTNAARQGVFSDKGVDAIKEANIRLREMTPATQAALGCVGLSLADFCALTPAEFRAVCYAWGRRNEGLEQGAWERMRLLATIIIQPHVKKRLTPGQLLPLPWEEERRPKAAILPAEQDKARLERLLGKRRGAKTNVCPLTRQP